MRHIRDATRSYGRRTTIHMASTDTTTLALRLDRVTTPTLLSPSQTRPHAHQEDNNERSPPEFQSNGFLNSPSRYFLAGLGIHYDSELDSSDVLHNNEKNHLSSIYDRGHSASYIQDVKNAPRYSTPAGTVFQLRDHAAKSFTCMSGSISSLGFSSDTSLPDLAYPSSPPLASLASTRFSFDHEGTQAPTAFSLPFHLEDDVLPCSYSNIGLIPDVNMYTLALLTKQPSVGVDPLDTMGRVSLSPRGTPSSSKALLSSSCKAASCGSSPTSGPGPSTRGAVRGLTTAPLSRDCPSSGIIHDIATIFSTTKEPDQVFATEAHSEQPFLEQCAPREGARASPILKLEQSDEPVLYFSPKQEECYVPLKFDASSFQSDGAFSPRQVKTKHDHSTQDDPHPSPVLNAHVGITLAELAFRAQRYRTRHPGQGIDRAWLMHFAGRLTDQGELIKDYRCYIVGCEQKNKRRDHILIHVGAHVDQRPFSCSVWFVSFLLYLQANTD
jgi:hypothetical protein